MLSRALFLVVVLVGVVLIITLITLGHRTRQSSSGDAMAQALRLQALRITPAAAGVSGVGDQIWCVITDWSFADGTATVIALAHGSASIYMTNGSSVIGGVGHESARASAVRVVEAAHTARAGFTDSEPMPLPRPHHVRFYAHIGTRLAASTELDEGDLLQPNSPLHGVFGALQELIAALKQVTSAGA